MTLEQRKRLEDLKVRLETLSNAGTRAGGYIVEAEQTGDDGEAERLISEAAKELASILKRPRREKKAK